MSRQLLMYVISFSSLAGLGYFTHITLLSRIAAVSPISITSLYLFFGGFSLALCVLLFLLLKTKKFKDQLGFLYLVSVALKIGIFCAVFSKQIFSEVSFTNTQSLNLLIPMFLMIGLEVFFISRLLNNLTLSKNAE
ncbi:MAG: hypothetical protein K0U54_13775 [Bacteroidetes bacterium]|nr:hypothetical protein [Bacteroidota bacterium]